MLIKLVLVLSILIAGCNSMDDEEYTGELLYRLPSNVKPSFYDLKIKIDVDNSKFEGEVTINIETLQKTKSIPINFKEIVVDWGNVVLEKDTIQYEYEDVELQPENEIAYIRFAGILEEGLYSMKLSFSGNIGNGLIGLYKSTYNTNKVIATTHFEPSYARMVFPCFDEPHLKAEFKITITHDKKYKAISNMPQETPVDPVNEENDFIVTSFAETPVMSTYLVAFIVSDYEIWSQESNYIAYAPPGKESHTDDSVQFAPKAMKALEDYLGVKYQLRLVQLASINDFLFGAMENWGLVTFRSEYLLYPNYYVSPRIHQHSRLLISHEFAHMWFGNEVTPEWWTYVWLSEGFAQFFQYYTTDELEPSWRIWEQFNVNNLQSALSQDDNNNIRTMSDPILKPADTQFDYIVYAKSSSIIRMFYELIGEKTFKAALNKYINDNSYKTVVPEMLFESFQSAIDAENFVLQETFAELFGSWSNELGYPVVTANVQTSTDRMYVSQKRFFVDPDLMKTSEKGNYFIPITVATDNNQDDNNVWWLRPDDTNITIRFDRNDKFVILNKLQTGYYRVNYNEAYWIHLANFLSDEVNINAVSVENRAQLIDDAANLAKAGLVSYDILFKLLHNLKHDADFLPWMAANNALSFLERMLLGSAQYNRFEKFLTTIPNLNYVNLKLHVSNTNNNHVERLHRLNSVAWACLYGHQGCVQEVRGIINNIVNEEQDQVDEIRPIVFCTFARYTDVINDELAQKMFTNILLSIGSLDEVKVRQRNEIITGFGCTRDSTQIESLLSLTTENSNLPIQINAEMRARIAVSLINGSYEGVKIMIRYLTDSFTGLLRFYQSTGIVSVLNALGPRILTEDVATSFDSFVTRYNTELLENPTINDAAIKAQTTIAANLKWRKAYGSVIEKWLEDNIDELDTTTINPGTGSSPIIVLSRAALFVAIAAMLRQLM